MLLSRWTRLPGPYCLVRRLPLVEAPTPGGIYLPTSAAEWPQIGRVILAGQYPNGYQPVKKGEFVIFPKRHDWTLFIDGEELLWFHFSMLIAALN